MTAITVLLVDDHLVVRSGLKALLGTQPDIDVVARKPWRRWSSIPRPWW